MKNLLLLLFLFVCSFGYAQFGPFNNIVDGEIESVDQMVAMDFDVDGDIDYVIRGGNYGGWYENTGSGIFLYHPLYITIGGYSAWIDVVDFDIDGDYDIAHVGGLDDTGIMENMGDGTVTWGPLPVSGSAWLTAGDIDEDGDPDFVGWGEGEVIWYEGDGTMDILASHDLVLDAPVILSLILIDFDGDTDLDILWVSAAGGGEVCFLENLGGADFADRIIVDAGIGNASSVAAADIDGDGDLDIIHGSWTADDGGKVYWNENLGAGVFGDRVLVSDAYSGENIVIAGDIDLDDDIDLVTSSYEDGKVVWFENTGDGTFEAPSILASDIEFVNDLELGDFDGDGDLDVHALGIYPAKVGWFENGTINPFHVEGQLFVDENENGIMDGAEMGLPWAAIESDPEGTIAITHADGTYAISFAGLPDGDYSIFPEALIYWDITSPFDTYNVTVSDDFIYMDTLDFGFFPNEIVDSLATDLTGGFTARCQDNVAIWLSVTNLGTTLPSGIMQLKLDDSLNYVSAGIVPDSIIGQNIYWSYETLFYFDSETFMVQVGTPDGISDTVTSVLTSSILELGDLVLAVTDTLTQPIVCAYDPNDKTPEPLGEGSEGNILASTEWIEYTIRFQNTGTDYAEDVIIRDQLDDNLIWTSIQPLYASHDMIFEFDPSGEVSFVFDNIMLADSNANEIESHGFVKFKVKLKPDLAIGTTIENTAEIYFDFNPAVITNTTLNTIAESVIDDAGITRHENRSNISIFPNPSSGITTVKYDNHQNERYNLIVVNLMGQSLIQMNGLSASTVSLDTRKLPKGIYEVQILKAGNITAREKLVVQ